MEFTVAGLAQWARPPDAKPGPWELGELGSRWGRPGARGQSCVASDEGPEEPRAKACVRDSVGLALAVVFLIRT